VYLVRYDPNRNIEQLSELYLAFLNNVIVLKIFLSVSNFDLSSGNTHEHALFRNQNHHGHHDPWYFPIRTDES
jgi:hypothetical protein